MVASKKYRDLSSIAKKQLNEIELKLGELQELRNIAFHTDLARVKQSTEEQVKLEGLKDYYMMRRSWGTFLKLSLGIILAFNILLVFLVGLNKLTFSDEWFLRIVLTTNLADIIGLVYLVVKFLFSHQSPEGSTLIKNNTRP